MRFVVLDVLQCDLSVDGQQNQVLLHVLLYPSIVNSLNAQIAIPGLSSNERKLK